MTYRSDEDTMPTDGGELAARLLAVAAPRLSAARWAGGTRSGSRSDRNEDAWRAGDGLFVVADGMGGRPGGDVAARLAVASADVEVVRGGGGAVRERAWNEAVRRGAEEAGVAAAGSTVVAAVVEGREVLLCATGDTRAYLLREGRLRQLTSDQTVREELAAAGVAPDEVPAGLPLAALTSYLGAEDAVVRLDRLRVEARGGDRLLLVTDGVYRPLGDAELGSLASNGSPDEVVAAILAGIELRQGSDDATVVVVDIGTERAGASAEPLHATTRFTEGEGRS